MVVTPKLKYCNQIKHYLIMKKNTLKLIGMFGACLIILTLTSCSNNKEINRLNLNSVLIKFPDKVFLTNATLIINSLSDFNLNAKRAYEIIQSDKNIITTGMTFSNACSNLLLDFDVVSKNNGKVLRVVPVPCSYTSSIPIRVLAYNIRRGLGTDYKTDIKRTVDVIKPLVPDLAALSEVDSNAYRSGGVKQAKYLGDVLGMGNRFYKTLDKPAPKNRGKGAYGEALLSRYPIQKTIYHTLPHKNNEELRIAIEIEVKIPDISGHTQTVSFISTHLDHTSGITRSNQVAKLLDDLKKVKHPIIVAGDLNSKPYQAPIKLFLNAGFRFSDEAEVYTFNAAKPTKKIDYILTRGNIKVYGPTPRTKVIDERLASDHRPLFAKLALGAVPANWLRKYGLPVSVLEGFIDSDGDSFDNYSEWLAGTDPTNAASFIKSVKKQKNQ